VTSATFKYDRIPFLVRFEEDSLVKETYAGRLNTVALEGQLLKPHGSASDTVLVFMHPSGTMNYLPFPIAMAQAGHHVMCCGSRYPHNDSALIMEKVIADLGAYVRQARDRFGYGKVVLAGWSGGGSLSLFYQAQAERPTITTTPAGDPYDLTGAGLVPADAVLQLAAHASRAIILTEWLDASIVDERDPDRRDATLNLYDPASRDQPPYTVAFIERYRAAQVERNRRITAWVQQRLEHLKRARGPAAEEGFVVHGTMADPRWLDPAVDPNDRKPNWCFMGDPRLVNDAPAGLARFCTLRSWLSQWSYDLSRANGPECAAAISVPLLVVENTADDGCAPSHTARIFGAAASTDRTLVRIEGATHYYFDQKDKLAQSATAVGAWLEARGFAPQAP
jgi:alpha-beta hydrolase superfamily lysophospholipase